MTIIFDIVVELKRQNDEVGPTTLSSVGRSVDVCREWKRVAETCSRWWEEVHLSEAHLTHLERACTLSGQRDLTVVIWHPLENPSFKQRWALVAAVKRLAPRCAKLVVEGDHRDSILTALFPLGAPEESDAVAFPKLRSLRFIGTSTRNPDRKYFLTPARVTAASAPLLTALHLSGSHFDAFRRLPPTLKSLSLSGRTGEMTVNNVVFVLRDLSLLEQLLLNTCADTEGRASFPDVELPRLQRLDLGEQARVWVRILHTPRLEMLAVHDQSFQSWNFIGDSLGRRERGYYATVTTLLLVHCGHSGGVTWDTALGEHARYPPPHDGE